MNVTHTNYEPRTRFAYTYFAPSVGSFIHREEDFSFSILDRMVLFLEAAKMVRAAAL